MALLARRNLFHDRIRFAVTLTGIVFALVLIIVQFGVGRVVGKKNVRTDEPSERVDTKILETLMQLDAGGKLPLGLRVDAYIGVGEQR